MYARERETEREREREVLQACAVVARLQREAKDIPMLLRVHVEAPPARPLPRIAPRLDAIPFVARGVSSEMEKKKRIKLLCTKFARPFLTRCKTAVKMKCKRRLGLKVLKPDLKIIL